GRRGPLDGRAPGRGGRPAPQGPHRPGRRRRLLRVRPRPGVRGRPRPAAPPPPGHPLCGPPAGRGGPRHLAARPPDHRRRTTRSPAHQGRGMTQTDFTALPDLAVRSLGGSVVAANDELFAERENLVKPEAPSYQTYTFGHKGQVYDGWETRRRREPGHDWAIVRLGLPGVVRGGGVDTPPSTGNYPPEVSVEGTSAEGWPAPDELAGAAWTPLVPRSPVAGDRANPFQAGAPERFTHVRLCIYPDGGGARLRVHGES